MKKCSEDFMEKENCSVNECPHATALRDIKNTVRKLSHDLSQPIMLLEGHLELLMLEKCVLGKNNIDQFVGTIKSQMDVLHNLHYKLRAIVAPVKR